MFAAIIPEKTKIISGWEMYDTRGETRWMERGRVGFSCSLFLFFFSLFFLMIHQWKLYIIVLLRNLSLFFYLGLLFVTRLDFTATCGPCGGFGGLRVGTSRWSYLCTVELVWSIDDHLPTPS